jgi:hypothetical protein
MSVEYAVAGLARAVASGVSRRTFLRRAGEAGLAAGLTLSWIGVLAEKAGAAGSCSGGACGPSPPCDYVVITGLCLQPADPAIKGRNYNTYQCASSGAEGGSWTESYGSSCASPGSWRCRDCAEKNSGTGHLVSGCGSGTWRACIRRKKL